MVWLAGTKIRSGNLFKATPPMSSSVCRRDFWRISFHELSPLLHHGGNDLRRDHGTQLHRGAGEQTDPISGTPKSSGSTSSIFQRNYHGGVEGMYPFCQRNYHGGAEGMYPFGQRNCHGGAEGMYPFGGRKYLVLSAYTVKRERKRKFQLEFLGYGMCS